MSINLNHDYEEGLRMAKPIYLGKQTIRPPHGALGDVSTVPSQIIPPLNTNIQFDILPEFNLSHHPGLASMDIKKIPKEFNWRQNGGSKKNLIAKPGNQMLCGSCWAISAAGLVSDNHVVTGTVDWSPNLSTTWCLSCFPQAKCKGGNPAILYQNISDHGIATNHCIDYSWCAENPLCNGKATKHFKAEHGNVDLSALVPPCGCYDSKAEHFLYFIDKPKSVSLGTGGLNSDNFAATIKKHIYTYGPVQGGFLVFKNFMHGSFTKVNGGIYLDNGVYNNGKLYFDDKQTLPENYVGSHAIAILGWGTEKIVVDNKGTKKDVPYWYCRNSWTEKWGDEGFFKMAMYPFNKMSQFDKIVVINSPNGKKQSGGMVMLKASKKPKSLTLSQIQQKMGELKRSHPDSYYQAEQKKRPVKKNSNIGKNIGKNVTNILKIVLVVVTVLILGYLLIKLSKRSKKIGRLGKYRFE